MTSPLRRAPRRSSHLSLVSNQETDHAPHLDEGFLISDRTYKADAVIDFTLRSFKQAASKRRTIIVPGYCGIKPAYGPFRDAVAEATGGDTVSYRTPRSQRMTRSMMRRVDSLLHPAKLSKQSVVAMIDMMRERYPDEKVTLIGHSKGGPDAVEGALRRLDDVEDVVLLGSGRLERGQNIVRLGKRMPQIRRQEGGSLREMPRGDALSMAGQALFHIVRNPIRTGGEALDIGSADIMTSEIRILQAHDIGVHAVQLEYDGFFPTDIAERDASWLVDSFSVIKGLDHLGPQTYPDIVAGHIAAVLSGERPQFLSEVS